MADSQRGERTAGERSNHALEPYTRRSVCRGLTATLLPLAAGCSSISEVLGGDPGDVTVFNDTDSTVTATIEVTELSTETTVLSESADIDPSMAAKFDDVFDSATRYRFDVETADGMADSYEWDLPSDAHYLYVTIRSGAIEFEENDP